MVQTAIIYARFSTTEQSKGYSLERQKTAGIEFATARGWTVEKTITDEGKSAFHAKNRAEGSALYEFELEARNGLHRGKALIVENIDRLSRQGAKAAAQLIWALNEAPVAIWKRELGHKHYLATIFGVDLLLDNVMETRSRLLEIAGDTPFNRKMVEMNITCNNALEYDYKFDETGLVAAMSTEKIFDDLFKVA